MTLQIHTLKKTFNEEGAKCRNICASNAIAENLNKIRNYLSDGEIKVLNEAIKKRFIAPALSNLFMRTLSSQLCYYLLVEDKETSKRLFQIILEEKIIIELIDFIQNQDCVVWKGKQLNKEEINKILYVLKFILK